MQFLFILPKKERQAVFALLETKKIFLFVKINKNNFLLKTLFIKGVLLPFWQKIK